MSLRRLVAALAAAATPACAPAVPAAPPPGAPPAVVQPAALPSAPAAGPSTTSTPPTPAPAAAPSVRVQGVVALAGRPFGAARMRAFDLATGQAIALLRPDGQGPATADAGTAVTGADGRFDVALPPLAASQVVKLVAERDGQALLTLVDGRGRSLAPPPAAYRVAQVVDSQLSLGLKLTLTPSTSAAAKAFEGTFKLAFKLDPADRDASLQAAYDRAQAAVASLAETLDANLALAERLAGAIGATGELADTGLFQDIIQATGADEALAADVRELLTQFVATAAASAGSDPAVVVGSEDFPLGDVTVTTGGDFSFVDEDGEVVGGSFEDGVFVEADPPDQPDPPGADEAEPADAGGALAVEDGSLIDPEAPETAE